MRELILYKSLGLKKREKFPFQAFLSFYKNQRRLLLLILRKWPLGCKLLGIPVKRISVQKTKQYFLGKEDSKTYFRSFPDTFFKTSIANYINFYRSKTSIIYKSENFIMSLAEPKYYHIHPSVVTSDGFQMAIVSNHPEVSQEEHALFQKLYFPRSKKVKGISFLLSTANDNNYYHCLFQIAPKIWQLQKHGFLLKEIDHYLLELSNSTFQKEILEKLGIERSKIVDLKRNKCIQPQQLILTPAYWKPEPWFCEKIRKIFLDGNVENKKLLKIYISRNKARFRRLLNEKEFLRLIEKYGFQIYFTEGMSVQEQANLFQSASIVISPHGAALSNILFCRVNTTIIELRGESHHNDLGEVFEHISSICNLKHYTYLCSEEINSYGTRAKYRDLKINIEEMKDVLKIMVANSSIKQ